MLDSYESRVRSYSRAFPATFEKARGSYVVDDSGRRYVDFFSGAGVVNYGHNHPHLKQAVTDYLESDGIVHALDLDTVPRRRFLRRFAERILEPRGLDYKVQFTGPTGADAVDAALKLARKVTRRQAVAYFTNAFHGTALATLGVTDSTRLRAAVEGSLPKPFLLAWNGPRESARPEAANAEEILDPAKGNDRLPAAVIVEAVQGEGGIRVADDGWLRRLAELCRQREVPLILDEIQTGCGRTGDFFAFEAAGIRPDLVCVSKALSGIGLPLAAVLIRPDLDQWEPGEHTGTFRSNNLALVAATAALDFWETDDLARAVRESGAHVRARLQQILARTPRAGATVRGRGLMWGVSFAPDGLAARVSREAFNRGVLAETAGLSADVLKLLPPLTTERAELDEGLDRIGESIAAAI